MSADIDFGVCALSDYDEDGHLQIQTDSPANDNAGGTQPAEAVAPFGIHGRPLDPDKDSNGEVGLGAGCLVITVGDQRYAIPIGDPRDVAEGRIPKLRKGGSMLAGGAGDLRSFLVIDGEDPAGSKNPGSITLSASYGSKSSKKSLGISMSVRDSGKEDISILHGNGQRITLGENSVTISNAGGDAYIEVGADGNVLAGDSKVQGSLTVGQIAAADSLVLAGPLSVFLGQLLAVVAAINASTTGAPAAALAALLPKLGTLHLKST